MVEKPFDKLCDNVSQIKINLAELNLNFKYTIEKIESLENKLEQVEALHRNCPGKALGKKYNTSLHIVKDISIFGSIFYFILEKFGVFK